MGYDPNQVNQKPAVPANTPNQEWWKENQWPELQQQGPPSPQRWQGYVNSVNKTRQAGLSGYQKWREDQIARGYTFNPNWEAAKNFQHTPKPYPKNYWERTPEGKYSGEAEYLQEIDDKINTNEMQPGQVGWTPDGRPYFGGKSEYQEWQLQYQSNMGLAESTSSDEARLDWDTGRLDEAYREGGIGGFFGTLLGGAAEAVEEANEYVDWLVNGRQDDKSAQASEGVQAWRKVVYGVKSPIMWLFSQASEVEKFIGGAMNAGHFLEGRPTLSEYDAIEAKRLRDAGDPNWYSKAITKANAEPTWANVKAEFWEGFDNSEWLYTAMWENFKGSPDQFMPENPFNPTGPGSLKIEEMKRELRADPSLNAYQVSEKYENMWTEMIGEAIFDPLWIAEKVGGGFAKGRLVGKIIERYGKYGDEMTEVFRAIEKGEGIGKLSGPADEVLKVAGVTEARGRQVDRIREGVETLAKDHGFLTATNGGKAHEVAQEVGMLDHWIASVSKGVDGKFDAEEFFRIRDAVGRSVSSDADERLAALQELSKLEGWDTVLTDPGTRSAMLIGEMRNKPDASWAKKLLDAENSDEMWAIADEYVEDAAKKWFPTIEQRIKAGEDVNGGLKALSKIHQATRPFYDGMNQLFSLVYLGLSPGYASRNFIQNNVQAFIDEGFGATALAFGNSESLVKAWAGVENLDVAIPGMKLGIGSARGGLEGTKQGILKAIADKAPATKWAGAAEDLQAVRIYGKVYPQTMKKLLKAADVPKQLMEAGLTEMEATTVNKLLLKHKGDANKAFDELIEIANEGYLEARRLNLDLSRDVETFLTESGLSGRYDEILRTATTKSAAKQAWNDLVDEFLDWAEKGVLDEVPVTSHSSLQADSIVAMTADGAPQRIMRGIVDHVNVNMESHQAWYDVLNNVTAGWTDILAIKYGQAKAQRMMKNFLNEVVFDADGKQFTAFEGILKGRLGKTIKTVDKEIYAKWKALRDDVSYYIKKKDWDKVREIYESAGLDAQFGEFSKDTNVIDKMWRGYENETRKLWSGFRDTQSGQVVEALDQTKAKIEKLLGKVIPDYGQQTTKARKALERGQKFDNFLHYNAIRDNLISAKKRGDMRGALVEWAKQYRINATGWRGGQKPEIAKFQKPLKNAAEMSEEQVDELVAMLIKADKRDEAIDFYQKYIAQRPEGATAENIADIAADELGLAEDVAKATAKQAEQAKKVADEFQSAAEGILKTVDSITDKVLQETGGSLYTADQYILNILNDQLNRSFKSMDELTVDALTWNEAEGALLAHALGERLKLFSDPERGMGLFRRFMTEPSEVFTDAQLMEIDELLYGMQVTKPKLVGEIRQMRKEYRHMAKKLDGLRDSPEYADKVDELDKLAADINKRLDEYQTVLEETEPEALAKMVQQTTEIPKRTGEFTTWSGENAGTQQRNWWEQREQVETFRKNLAETIDSQWEKRVEFQASKDNLKKYKDARRLVADEVSTARRISNNVARETRNFILHDYKLKKNADLFLGYMMPYSFWYSRTYAKWLKRAPQKAGTMSAYARYKRNMAKEHHDLPEWWKYNINVNELLGIESDSPFFFNLEATLNPLNGLTGVDFNDPSKRTNWFTGAVDQMGKYGPSLYTPLSMGIGAYYYAKGEEELGQKWAGRLIPQSSGIKALTAVFGANEGRGVEIDPMVRWMSGGTNLDLWELKRAGRALAWAVENGTLSQEEAIEAARTREGEAWNNAVALAQSKRSAGNIASMFLGVGFKARTKEDVQIDKMDSEYSRFIQAKGDMSPQEVKDAYEYFRTKYPFFDTVKLSRRNADERDTSYSYNVLSRIPPGMRGDAYRSVGITYEQTQEFYENKGIPSDWKESEKSTFVEGLIQLGALLAIPQGATRHEWREVGIRDKAMYEGLEAKYGEHIRDAESMYWDIYTRDGWQAAKEWIKSNPDVQEYMNEKTSIRMNDPLLARYYASYDKARSLLWSRREGRLNEEFPNIQTKIDQYYEIKLGEGSKSAKAYLEANPEIQKYWDTKAISEQGMYETLLSYETWLPEGEEIAQPVLRQDPEALAQQQTEEGQRVLGELEQQDTRPPELDYSYEQWQGIMNPTLQRLVSDWVEGDEMLSYQAEQALKYALQDAGIESDVELAKLLIFRSGRGYGPNP